MFRVNRIGDHSLVDLVAGAVKNPITSANFANVVGTPTVFHVQTDRSTLISPGSFTNLFVNISGNYTMNFGESFAWGRFVDGTHLNDREVQYSIVGAAEVLGNRSTEGVSLSCNIGELDSGSVSQDYTTQVNTVTNAVLLPADIKRNDQIIQGRVACSAIDGLFEGGTTAFSTQPIGAFWGLVNDDSADFIIEYMRMTLSIYRYVEDIDTFDPSR